MISIKRLTPTAIMPTKANPGDAGFDLYADEEVTIPSGYRAAIKTGISVQLPEPGVAEQSYYMRIAPRSGLAVKKGIDVFAGVCDNSYTGEYIVCLFNSGQEPVQINKGDKIAQMIPTVILNDTLVEVENLSETERGANGFGSSGQ